MKKDYQLFVVTMEGDVKEHYTLKCANDDRAQKLAEQFLTTDPVELWEGPRHVARFQFHSKNQPSDGIPKVEGTVNVEGT
jgi:hypothetical protein